MIVSSLVTSFILRLYDAQAEQVIRALSTYTHLKYEYVFCALNLGLRVRVAVHLGRICSRVFRTSTWEPTSLDIWKFGAMCGAAGCQRFSVAERGHSSLAAQYFLDVAGAELHLVDAWAI